MKNATRMIHEVAARRSTLLDNKYWEFFIPTILMAMTLTMSIVVDSIIVGNMLGSDALAAVNLVMPVIMVYNTVAVCFGLGAATLISVAKGRRQGDYANVIFTTTLSAVVSLSLILLLGQEIFLDEITRLLTREPSLRPLVSSYLHVLVWGTPLIITIPGLAYCLRVDGRVRLASTVLIVSNLVNLALDLVYMGPLKMGIAGSSLATVSGYIVGGLVLLSYVFSKERSLRFYPGAVFQVVELFGHIKKILVTGAPAAMGSILITFKILCINHIVLAVAGKSGMVAFSVCLSCLSFVSMFISGAAQAMTPIVGVLYGELDYTGIRFVMQRASKTLLLASIAVTVLLELFPGQVMALFGVHLAADIAEGVPAIRLFSVSLIGTSITFLCMYYFMTIGHTKLSTAISFVQGAVVVPMALIISRFLGSSGVWLSFSFAEIATILMVAGCYFHLKKTYPEKYQNPLLLDIGQLPLAHTLETTITTSSASIEEGVQGLATFMDEQEVECEVKERVEKTVGEYVHLAAEHSYSTRKNNYVDLTIQLFPDKVVARLRDSGKGLDLSADSFLSRGIAEMCAIEQSQAIGFNNTIFTFTRG